MRLPVPLEDVRQRGRRDSPPCVLDLYLHLRARVHHAHDHTAAARREPDRVGGEVHDHLHETILVAGHDEPPADALAIEGDARLVGAWTQLLHGTLDQERDVDTLAADRLHAGA